MARPSTKRSEGDPCRCAIGFILAILFFLPLCIHMTNQFQEPGPQSFGRDTIVKSPTSDKWASVYQFATDPQLSLHQPIISNHNTPIKSASVYKPDVVKSEKPSLRGESSSQHDVEVMKQELKESIAEPRRDGLVASSVGHSWSLLPCAADQACAKPSQHIAPTHHVQPNDVFKNWKDNSRSQEVSKFVNDLSLDILRVGGTGEARLRARRHSAYNTNTQLNGADSQDETVKNNNERCNALFKSSSQQQLRKLIGDIRNKKSLSEKTGQSKSLSLNQSGALQFPPGKPIPQHIKSSQSNFVAFTITDATYGDMLNEVWSMMSRLKLTPYFFYVALDKPTAMAACHHHMPTLMFNEPLSLPDSQALPPREKKFKSTKDRVYEAKYGIALALTLEKVNFLFFEMDCWLLQHPMRAVVDHHIKADLYMSLHQDNPFEFNVGYFYVKADTPDSADRTSRFWQATLSYLRTHSDSFDQKLINCLMKFYSSKMDRTYHSLFSRAGCKGQKISMDDKALVALTSQPDKVMKWALFELDDVLSNAIPILARDTSTLHVLTNVPLTAASGKKVVAKDLMVWEGAYCYYCVGAPSHHDSKGAAVQLQDDEIEDRLSPLGHKTDDEHELHVIDKQTDSTSRGNIDNNAGEETKMKEKQRSTLPRRRYIAYDGPITAADLHFDFGSNTDWTQLNHVETLAATILELVALAIHTERILILPLIQHDARFVRAWEMLDMISAEQFVEWRETSFLRNPRLSVSDDATAARVTMGAQAATLELWRWGAQDEPIQPPKAYSYPEQSNVGDGMRTVLLLAPEAQLADLLLVAFDREYKHPEKQCFKTELSLCEHLSHDTVGKLEQQDSNNGVKVAPWVTVLASSMRWCMLNQIKVPQVAGIKALDDCFASTERLMSKGQWKVNSDWYASASDRCLVASLQREVESNKKLSASSALAVAHILRQKGSGSKTKSSFSSQPKEVAAFAERYSAYMQERLANPAKSC